MITILAIAISIILAAAITKIIKDKEIKKINAMYIDAINSWRMLVGDKNDYIKQQKATIYKMLNKKDEELLAKDDEIDKWKTKHNELYTRMENMGLAKTHTKHPVIYKKVK